MNSTALDRMAFRLYGLGWRIAIPFLQRNSRISEGFDQRRHGPAGVSSPIDIWIQAASAGEAYLALAILSKIAVNRPLKILLTTNTRQGFDILSKALSEKQPCARQIFIAYFPFDDPRSMAKVVKQLRPRITVLLETEIWPGLLLALKKNNLPAVILNGRLSPKSLKHYLFYPGPFRAVAPAEILAISPADAQRYGRLFPATPVTIMPNIKFDRITFADPESVDQNPLRRLFGKTPDMIVLGSIREEEEAFVEKIIVHLLKCLPHIRIALFPRHMHRLNAWQTILDNCGHPWLKRSAITGPISKGSIILWDTFGELAAAYAMARAVFVGGSLADLGGQNFLEPLSYGIRPVIGPYWDNFFWIGRDIFRKGLVQRCTNRQTVATRLVQSFESPPDPQKVSSQAKDYVRRRQGGTLQACNLIENMLKKKIEVMPSTV